MYFYNHDHFQILGGFRLQQKAWNSTQEGQLCLHEAHAQHFFIIPELTVHNQNSWFYMTISEANSSLAQASAASIGGFSSHVYSCLTTLYSNFIIQIQAAVLQWEAFFDIAFSMRGCAWYRHLPQSKTSCLMYISFHFFLFIYTLYEYEIWHQSQKSAYQKTSFHPLQQAASQPFRPPF